MGPVTVGGEVTSEIASIVYWGFVASQVKLESDNIVDNVVSGQEHHYVRGVGII